MRSGLAPGTGLADEIGKGVASGTNLNLPLAPGHGDAEYAAIYGGLIASGFQVVSLTFRLFIQMGILAESSMGSPGIDELRWFAPARPGDTLHAEVEVMAVIPSKSKPDRGIVRMRYSAFNQRHELVSSFVVNHLLRRREAPNA